MTGEDRTVLSLRDDIEAAIGWAFAEGDEETATAALAEHRRLLAVEEAARNCSGSPEHFGGCGCTCHAALEGAPHDQ